MSNLVRTTDEIRANFLSYFRERGHEIVGSSPLVPENDPTLLFTNAGMVQFKDVFTGKEQRVYRRAATAQKCVRAGGKHNDLENVGVTARHHTFFEMLGNFSFGDYFKADAIAFAWDFLTRVLQMPKERLCVTVFRGDEAIPEDTEAASLWEKMGVARDRIFRFGRADNYWQMGDTGPQGPCSEIHYYLGDLSDPDFLAEDRVGGSKGWLEIWNLVFMQFEREGVDAPLVPLPRPSIDTGAGLERISMVLEGKASNYETDVFLPLILAVGAELKKTYGGFGTDNPDDVSMRVIADHARATAFLVADGVQPSNTSRGYVLRRIMRRAIRHGRRLGYREPFFYRVCTHVVDRMAGAYPELLRARPLIEKVAEAEEIAFRRTLDRGLKLLEDGITKSREENQIALSPAFVADLYSTYGFPIDLTRLIANERGFAVDEDAAEAEVAKQSVGQPKGSLGVDHAVDRVWYDVRERAKATEFVGYDHDEARDEIRALVANGQIVGAAEPGDVVDVVLGRTPFYGESGGQAGDRGRIVGDGFRMDVLDTQRPRADLVVHRGRIVAGTAKIGLPVVASIDVEARNATRRNHSATHLLHLALKETLGAHVQQKGSLVSPDRLRFDYSHFEAVSWEQLRTIERRVNALILADAPTETDVTTQEGAKEAGAVMLFGEKYGDRVRMVRIANESVELCGGTHVRRAGEIGLFKILSDLALAAGVRRLEAVTGLLALKWAQEEQATLSEVSSALKCGREGVVERVERLVKRTKELERELDQAKADLALSGKGGGDVLSRAEAISGIRVLFHRADGVAGPAIRDMADKLRDAIQSGVIVLSSVDGDKASVLVAVTKDLAGAKAHAGELVRCASVAMEGRGGGRPDLAQGGGKAEWLERGLAEIRRVLEGKRESA